MRELFEEQLLLLNQELTEMGALCEEIISLASQALVSYDKALGEKVSRVGAKIDEEERTIETICMRLLLRQQPVARDLRAVSAALFSSLPPYFCSHCAASCSVMLPFSTPVLISS